MVVHYCTESHGIVALLMMIYANNMYVIVNNIMVDEWWYLMDMYKVPAPKMQLNKGEQDSKVGTAIIFEPSMKFNSRKDDFLSNKDNKQPFINLLDNHLERNGCNILHARAYADLLIARTTIAVAEADKTKPTILVADDTDVLLLLCYHSKPTTPNIYFRPEPRQ